MKKTHLINRKLLGLVLAGSLALSLTACATVEVSQPAPTQTTADAADNNAAAANAAASNAAAASDENTADAEKTDGATEYTFTTREIRKSNAGDAILPTPTEYVIEKDGDQERFDSFVWSVDKLKDNFDDVVIIDARAEDAYKDEHIPGAVNATWQSWSNVDVPQDSGEWSLLDDPDVLAEKLAALGIDGTKTVVIYNDPLNGWGEEGRQLWSLRYYGLDNSYILNGGIPAWKAAGGEVTDEKTEITPTDKPSLTKNDEFFASTEYLASHLDDNILDVRDDQEYSALTNSGEKRNGRVPGSLHVWYKDFYHDDGTLFTPAEIRARVEPLGYSTDEPIIAYCTGGIRSGFSTIVLRIAGYDQARNYDASFSGWAGTDQNLDDQVYSDLSVVNN